MTLADTTSSASAPQRGLQRRIAIGLLVAAQAVHCAPSRPAQRAASAAPSPAVAPSSSATVQGAQAAEQANAQQGPAPQAQPAATSAAAPAVGGLDSSDKIPDGAIVGKIVSSFRGDDGAMTLYLDQGSKSRLRVGMTGHILEGGEGGKKLGGGAFLVSKVLGDNQSVATSKYSKSLGKNHRFMIVR